MERWFCNHFNKQYDSEETSYVDNDNNYTNDLLNCQITVDDVKRAIFKSSTGKTKGCDNIPIEDFKNDCSVSVQHM